MAMDVVRREKEKQEEEECRQQIELLQLQEKRMNALVKQRREERQQMDTENARMERQLKFMKEMMEENQEAEVEWEKEQAAKRPFGGTGSVLGSPLGGSLGGGPPPSGVAARSAAATAAAARLFGGAPSVSQVRVWGVGRLVTTPQGAAPGRVEAGAAGCTGRVGGGLPPRSSLRGREGAGERREGGEEPGERRESREEQRANPHLEAVRTMGPGRLLGIDEAQWGTPATPGTTGTTEAPSNPAGPAPKPVNVDPSQPTGNVQVRLADGARVVVRLNAFHTVAHVRQEVRSRRPQEARDFDLVTLGPPSKVLEDDLELKVRLQAFYKVYLLDQINP